MEILNFAYGSNMLSRRLRARARSARFLATGYISEHRLTFDKKRRTGSGKCDAEKTGLPEDRVYGVVYKTNGSDKRTLDFAESLGDGYAEKRVTVVTDRGSIDAMAYYATRKDKSLKPYHWYKKLVLAGAREHSLPADYIAAIENVESIKDPDEARCARERKFLERRDK
jgi:gamma-glutamylcyclotransferase